MDYELNVVLQTDHELTESERTDVEAAAVLALTRIPHVDAVAGDPPLVKAAAATAA